MNTITIPIPKNLIKEKDLMLISRSKYENLLKRLGKISDLEKSLWQDYSTRQFIKSYSKTDAIYDAI